MKRLRAIHTLKASPTPQGMKNNFRPFILQRKGNRDVIHHFILMFAACHVPVLNFIYFRSNDNETK